MNQTCKNCKTTFEISDEDLAFYKSVSPVINGKTYEVPVPTFCMDCRQQRRLSFRNERNLYKRKSDLGGKQVVTMYAPESPYKVYDQAEWWSDKFDPLQYGRDFDFNKSFFEQFHELMLDVPRISLINKEPTNSEYCNFAFRNKDCYLLFTAGENDECCYSNRIMKSRNTFDASNILNLELCYEAVDSEDCYNCHFVKNCSNCSDCVLGQKLRGCKKCFASFGLVNKQYHVGNVQCSKEEYPGKIAAFMADLKKSKSNFDNWLLKMPRKYADVVNVDNCIGDSLSNSKNSKYCFECKNLQDCSFVYNATSLKDCRDVNNDDHSELVYESIGSESNYMHAFNDICWFNNELFYSNLSFNSKNCFGCVGLKKNQYCILNKQYTKDDYEKLVPKIIEKMMEEKSWGEFFPANISPFAYNESMAQDYYPLTKDAVLGMGLKWRDDEEQLNNVVGAKLPSVNDATEDVCKEMFVCETSGKSYKILPAELRFYKKTGLPLPSKAPNQRHKDRLAMRNPRKIYDRKCDQCGTAIFTTYSPDRSEKVYCEGCYLKMVY